MHAAQLNATRPELELKLENQIDRLVRTRNIRFACVNNNSNNNNKTTTNNAGSLISILDYFGASA